MGTVTFRVRSLVWFVTGALLATAVTLMFANAWRVDAAPGDDDATFVPITPCRLADTRPASDRVGTTAALGVADTKTFAVHGANGECTIPSEAVAVSMNVTALGASTQTFLTFWPDGDQPLASSLNPAPGEPPTPNAVTVDLSGAGAFNVYNDTGTVNVVIDVNGYYITSSLTELASRLAALETVTDTNTAAVATLDAAQPFTVTNNTDTTTFAETTWTDIIPVTVTAPVDGNITVIANMFVFEDGDFQAVMCGINDADDDPGSQHSLTWRAGSDVAGGSGTSNHETMTPVRTFEITQGATVTYYLMCRNISFDTSRIFESTITAIFTPAP